MHWKRIAIWGTLLAGLLIIAYVASNDLVVSVGQDAGLISSEEIQGGVTVGQTFTAPYSGLQRIAVMVRTFDRLNTHDVIFHLRQGREAREDIWADSFNGGDVKDGQWQYFSFPPLGNSAGASYYFYFESPQSTPGNAIAIRGQQGDPYPDGLAYLGNEPLPGDMAFKAHFQVPLPQQLGFILNRLATDRPSIWGNRYFYTGLGLVYFLLILVLIGYAARRSEEMEAEDELVGK